MNQLYNSYKSINDLNVDHVLQQEKLGNLLSSCIEDSTNFNEDIQKQKSALKNTKDSYGTSWLPGSLSYPWVAMVIGISKMMNYFTS